MNLIAVHEVHVCKKPGAKGVRPETIKIAPKGKFDISDKQGEELIKMGAAILDTEAGAEAAKADKAAEKAAKKAADEAAKKAADEASKKAEDDAAKKADDDEDEKLV